MDATVAPWAARKSIQSGGVYLNRRAGEDDQRLTFMYELVANGTFMSMVCQFAQLMLRCAITNTRH